MMEAIDIGTIRAGEGIAKLARRKIAVLGESDRQSVVVLDCWQSR